MKYVIRNKSIEKGTAVCLTSEGYSREPAALLQREVQVALRRREHVAQRQALHDHTHQDHATHQHMQDVINPESWKERKVLNGTKPSIK